MIAKDIYRRFKYGGQQLALRKKYKALYEAQERKNGSSQVRFYNWWNAADYSQMWLYRFVQNTGLLEGTDKKLNFCSTFAEREVLKHVKDGVKVFFSGENLHLPWVAPYADALLGDKDCALSVGFDCFEDKRYMRFPLWLTYVFEPTLDEKQIRERCAQLRYPEIGDRDKFACLIARADESGLRTEMYKAMNEVGKVDCPSGLFHNDDSLKEQFEDDKVKYMRQYMFNICPENSNAYGYCTEKVFEAIAAGCVPVYWGDYNKPEQRIVNPDAVVFWNKENGGKEVMAKIRELSKDKKQLEAFMMQPRLLPTAEEEVMRMMREFYERLKELMSSGMRELENGRE